MRLNMERESGYALPLAMTAIVVFSIIMTTYLSILTHELRINQDLIKSRQGKYVAESGVDNAIYKIKLAVYDNAASLSGSNYQVLLPSNSLSLAGVISSGGGILQQDNGPSQLLTDVGQYRWVIKYDQTLPNSREGMTTFITVESVSLYSGAKYRIRVPIEVDFQPTILPDSPVSIKQGGYSEITTEFSDWEPSVTW